MINIGIVGGAGYTGGELIRILQHHPDVDIDFVQSTSQEGKRLCDVHPDLLDLDLRFSGQVSSNIDLLFLCTGHGRARSFMEQHQPEEKIIDLSHDFRLLGDHSFVYGLPELNKEAIKTADRIANPGCFATAIQLALLPLAQEHCLADDVHITAITGSTGAGQKPSATTHFSWRNNNVSVYKAFAHQHLGEIGQSLRQLQSGFELPLNFVPVRGNFSRGILASVYTKCDWTQQQAEEAYKAYYQDHPFVFITDQNPDLKQVVNTNRCVIYPQVHDGKLHLISMIDNLLKGASGQAVQNMNLMYDLPETRGLILKSIAF